MEKEKDPAFLLYSKDWLQGTAGMMPEEKGVYIDLLAHQHQEKDLPNDTKRLARMVGMSESDFLPIWVALTQKFKPNENNRLVNLKLTKVMTNRSTKSETNKITGTFAAVIRLSGISQFQKIEIKKLFKVDDFLTIPDELLTQRLTEWLMERLKSIGDGNEDGNGNGTLGKSENPYSGPRLLMHDMHDIWKTTFPTYTDDIASDFPACRSMADFIFRTGGVANGFGNADAEMKVLNTMQLIADEVKKDPFWVNKPLKSISNNIQEFYNKIKNPINGSGNKKTNGTKLDDAKIKQKLAERDPSRR